MVDMLGNEVRVGSLLYWAPTNSICQVLAMDKASVTVGIRVNTSGDRLAEFVAVVNPAETKALSDTVKELEGKADAVATN